MKLMCISRDLRGYLKVGKLYTFQAQAAPCRGCKRTWTAVAEILDPNDDENGAWICAECKAWNPAEPSIGHRWFASRRLVPWNPDFKGEDTDADVHSKRPVPATIA